MVDKKRLTRRKPRQMNVLLHGCESAERIEIILSLVSFRSETVKNMLRKYYVDGTCKEYVETMVGDAGNWARAVKKLNEVAIKIERIKEIDGCVKVLK